MKYYEKTKNKNKRSAFYDAAPCGPSNNGYGKTDRTVTIEQAEKIFISYIHFNQSETRTVITPCPQFQANSQPGSLCLGAMASCIRLSIFGMQCKRGSRGCGNWPLILLVCFYLSQTGNLFCVS